MRSIFLRSCLALIALTFLTSCMGDSADIKGDSDYGNSRRAGKAVFLYEASDGNDMEIYAADVVGGTSGKLTNNSTADQFPFPTPDGSKLAWACDDGNNYEVCLFDSESGETTQLTKGDVDLFPVSWIDGGKRILVASCSSLAELKLNAKCEKAVYDVKTGAHREIKRGQDGLTNLPSDLTDIYILSVSPASDLLLVGDENNLVFVDSKNFAVRTLNTQGKKFIGKEWLGREAVLVEEVGSDSAPSSLFILRRSGQAVRFAPDAVTYTVCLNDGFAELFTACEEGQICIETERWEGTPSGVAALESNGNLTLYDAKTGTKKSAAVEAPNNPRILCNGSNRIVLSGSKKITTLTKSNLAVEGQKVIDDGRFVSAISPDGRYAAITLDSFDDPNAAENAGEGGGDDVHMPDTVIGIGSGAEVVGMPGPMSYVAFMTLPDGEVTQAVQMGGQTIEFTKDGKYAVSGGTMYDPTNASLVEMPASLANQMGYGPMGVGLQGESGGPLVMFDVTSGDSLSLAGEIPIALSQGATITTSWLNLTDAEFQSFAASVGKTAEFSPDGQEPRLAFDANHASSLSSGDSIACSMGNSVPCSVTFKLKTRKENPQTTIAVVEKGKDKLPDFMTFNQQTGCTSDAETYSKIPGIKKVVTTCNIVINQATQQAGAYDLNITATSAGEDPITKELHMDIVE